MNGFAAWYVCSKVSMMKITLRTPFSTIVKYNKRLVYGGPSKSVVRGWSVPVARAGLCGLGQAVHAPYIELHTA